ncbi:unnamed protein product [Lactuca saligna]|uniref:Uncharacterized protein n=1 Tax=Lactuca saligna TaxID=75948 RepID=A0AA36A0K9_LACSI|nr:unnamed protein product [Lactuca saligna]
MKPKVNVKKFDGGNSRFSKSKENIQKQKGLIESYDMTQDSGINRENELRTKIRFDRCKIKGDEVVVINSCSRKDNVTVKKLDEDEDSDFEDDKPVCKSREEATERLISWNRREKAATKMLMSCIITMSLVVTTTRNFFLGCHRLPITFPQPPSFNG